MSGQPLAGLAVGLSMSESDDVGERGFDAHECRRLTARLIEALLAQGATIVLGHDWRRDGVLYAALDASRRYGPGDGTEPVLKNVVPWPTEPALDESERERWAGLLSVTRMPPPEGVTEGDEARRTANDASARAAALTEMHRHLVETTDARICVGGRSTRYQGRVPGVIEEAYLSAQAQQPLYVTALWGGASAWVVQVLRGEQAGELGSPGPELAQARAAVPASPTTLETAFRRLAACGADDLAELSKRNRLSPDENRALFDARTADQAIRLVLLGLGRVARER